MLKKQSGLVCEAGRFHSSSLYMESSELVDYLIARGVLKTPRIIEAFRDVDRAHFVPEEYRRLAYDDAAFPIGYGATISQPYTVAFMLELLSPAPGNIILDIGSGSGWATALLAHITGEAGKVYGMDVSSDLVRASENRIGYHYPELLERISFFSMNAKNGLPQYAPYDRIMAAASLLKRIPLSWKDQLEIGGTIVAPVKDSIAVVKKTQKSEYETEIHPGFVFVPFQE